MKIYRNSTYHRKEIVAAKKRLVKSSMSYLETKDKVSKMNKCGLEIDFLAVEEGKGGDAILMRYGDLYKGQEHQKVVVIDGGYAETAVKIKCMLEKYYNCKNTEGKYLIDLMILSHTDQDHVNGLVELANDSEVRIENVLMCRPWEILDKSLFRDKRITDKSLEDRLKEAFDKVAKLDDLTQDCGQVKSNWEHFYLEGFKDAVFTILSPSDEFYREMLPNSAKTPDAKNESFCNETFSNNHKTVCA